MAKQQQQTTPDRALYLFALGAAVMTSIRLLRKKQPCREPMPPESKTKKVFADAIRDLQDKICHELEIIEAQETKKDDPKTFREDLWTKTERGSGGGRTRVMEDGIVFEKAGVNTSEVTGNELPPALLAKYPNLKGSGYYATGLSLVIHPRNPHIPTTHMNIRYFECGTGDNREFWFGGGVDQTPYYLVEEDCQLFHTEMKRACTAHEKTSELYPIYKAWCDEYFWNEHRDEHRGIGGLFFDYLDGNPTQSYYQGPKPKGKAATLAKAHKQQDMTWSEIFDFVTGVGEAFIPSYIPIVKQRCRQSYTAAEQRWQQVRRGRYVEYNLRYDRGTLFGLQTKGRIESILMSLPPVVRYDYMDKPEEGTKEHAMWLVNKEAKEWV